MVKLIMHFDRRIPTEEEMRVLIINADKKLSKVINLIYYEGMKLADAVKLVGVPRRTLQHRLTKLGEKVLNQRITFQQIRQACSVRLLYLGISPLEVQKKMGYTNREEWRYRRRVEGYISPELRFAILKRDNFKCSYCGGKEGGLQIDHEEPLSKGGKTIKSNLRTACAKCNNGKGSKDWGAWE